MARMRFGGGPQDVYLYEDEEGDLHAGGGFNALFFDGPGDEAAPITDLLNDDLQAVTYITTSDGSDGHAPGQVPVFYGPDGVYEMWGSINQSPRQVFASTNVGSFFGPTKTSVDELLNVGDTNPFNTTLRSLTDVDGAGLDAASAGTTIIKQVDGTYAAGSAPIPMSDVLWVAANDAPSTFDSAPYQCDGTADNVEIQAAINNPLGLTVALTPGTFNLAARIEHLGSDNVDIEMTRILRGSGTYKTKLVVGNGVSAGIFLSNAVSSHLSDFEIVVAGASHGIHGTRSATPAAGNRSFFHSSIKNIAITGPWNGTHTGWAMKLGSGFRYVVENIEVGGVGNGIQVLNESEAFNCGDATFNRCFVEVVGANATAYHVRSDAGNANQVLFLTCHAIANPAYTGTVGWKFDGASRPVSHIRSLNCNVEQFATTVFAGSTVSDLDLDFVHVTQVGPGNFAQVAGYHNRIKAGLVYIPSGNVVLINDTNVDSRDPNTYDYAVYAEAGSSISTIPGAWQITNGVVNGPGAKSLNAIQPGPARWRTAAVWTMAGSLAGKVGVGVFRWYNDSNAYATIRSVRATVGTAPTGASIIVDVNVGGTTIYTTQSSRPTIAASGTTSGKAIGHSVYEVAPGGYVTVDIDQVGSTVAGADLVVQLDVS